MVVPWTQYPRLAVAGLVTLFGSVNVAVLFLLDMLQIPADMFELFLATSIVNARFGTLIAAMHTLTLALLGTASVLGTLQIIGPIGRRIVNSVPFPTELSTWISPWCF